MADSPTVLEQNGDVATIRLNRPEQYNALDIPTLESLQANLLRIDRDADIRVMILTGEGKGFCAGGDIDAWGQLTATEFQHDWVRFGHRVFDLLATLRVPTLACLNGHALGGGFELAAACDLRVAEEHVKIGMPETSIGVVPGWSGSQRMVRRFGSSVVRRMCLGGEVFNAADAQSLGLVDRHVSQGNGMQESEHWAKNIAARAPLAIEATKLMINAAEHENIGASVEALASGFVGNSNDLREGVAAFRDKRDAHFRRT